MKATVLIGLAAVSMAPAALAQQASAVLLTPGSPVNGALEAGDRQSMMGRHEGRYLDSYRLQARAGQPMIITVDATGFDPVLDIWRDGASEFFSSDTSPAGARASVVLRPSVTGEYGITLSSRGTARRGAYRITVNNGGQGSAASQPAPQPGNSGSSGGSGASQPVLLSFGAPAVGIISAMDPRVEASGRRHDLFAFDGRAGQRVRIAVDSRFFDTYVELLADSEVLAFNDDAAGRGTNSLIEHTLPRTARYLVRVSPFRANANDAGLYNVEVSEAGTTPAAPAGTVTMSGADLATTLGRAISVTPTRRINGLPVLEAGLVYRGTIAPGDDVVSPGQYSDSYVFEGRRDQRLTLTMRSSDVDATLAINNASGFRLYNDDGPNLGTSAQISTVLPADGLYTITASTYSPSVGEYTIEVAAEAGSPLTSAAGGPTSEGQTASGSLSATDDRFDPERYADRYSLDGRRGERVRITARSRAFDTRLVLRGPNNFEASNDDGPNMGTNSQLDATLPADGPYQLLITSFGPGMTGDYTINMVSQRGGSATPPPAPTPPAPTPPALRPPTATPGTSVQVIRPGEVVEGEVRPGGSSGAALLFDAQVGERYSVVVEPVGPGLDPAVTVTGPDRRRHIGDNITRTNRTARIVFTASATGRHQILPRPDTVVQGAQSTGRYRVRLARHPMQTCPDDSSYRQAAAPDLRFGSGGTIGIGERACGNLAPGDTPMMGAGTPWVDRWQVTLRPGQVVSVAASSQNLSTPVQWRIVAPANTPEPIVEPQPLDWLKVTARAAGRYTIEVYTEAPMVIDYVLHVTPVNN